MKFPLSAVLSGAYVAVLLAACSVQPDSDRPAAPVDADQEVRSPLASTPPAVLATPPAEARIESPHPYVGMWVTADGYIRQELLANGRYDEARGERQSAYTGSYQVFDTRIEYVDDTGFTADGRFDKDILYHGGYVFHRAQP